MGYTSNWKDVPSENSSYTCRECNSDDLEFREWESGDGAHEDLQYRCKTCDKSWWVEGIDY